MMRTPSPYSPPTPKPALITEGNTRTPAAFRPSSRAEGFWATKLCSVALASALIWTAEAALAVCGAATSASTASAIRNRARKAFMWKLPLATSPSPVLRRKFGYFRQRKRRGAEAPRLFALRQRALRGLGVVGFEPVHHLLLVEIGTHGKHGVGKATGDLGDLLRAQLVEDADAHLHRL